MLLSVPTLIFVTTIVSFTTSMLLAISWLQNQSARCLYYWSASNLIGTIAALLFAQRGVLPDILTMHVANVTLFLSAGIAWAGMRTFVGKTYSKTVIFAGPVIWIVANLFPAIEQSMFARIVLSAVFVAAFAFAAAYELWMQRAEKLMSRYPAILISLLHGGFFLARIPASLRSPIVDQRDLYSSPLVTVIALETLIYVVAISFLRIALVKERAESASRRAVATDQLTGAISRRAFFEDAAIVLEKCSAQRSECSVMIIDIDHFKIINDRWGHAAGDLVLQQFAQRAQQSLGAQALFARLGGEEFAAVLPAISPEDAFALARNILEALAAEPFDADGNEHKVTASIGIAFSHRSGYNLERLLRHADKALYCAKNNGRDRIECSVLEERATPRLVA